MPRRKTKIEEPVIEDIRNPDPAKLKQVKEIPDTSQILLHILNIAKAGLFDTFVQFACSRPGVIEEVLKDFKKLFKHSLDVHGIKDEELLSLFEAVPATRPVVEDKQPEALEEVKETVKAKEPQSYEDLDSLDDELNSFGGAPIKTEKKVESKKEEKTSNSEQGNFFNDLNIL